MEPKKASEVILELDNKLNAILELLTNHDMLIKNISNKLNDIREKLNISQTNPYTMEAVDTLSKNINISSELTLPEEKFPISNRRITRPDNTPAPKITKPSTEDAAEIIVNIPNITTEVQVAHITSEPIQSLENQNLIPTYQKVVNAQGKSQFMADVEILDSSLNSVFKGRTNGVGKWQASLPTGKYKINIKKLDALTKNRLESSEVIIVDGTKSPLELGSIIIK